MKIDKSIEVPKERGVVISVVEKMQEGDSVFFDDCIKGRSFLSNGVFHLKGTKFNLLSRSVEGGIRIWKIKRSNNNN